MRYKKVYNLNASILTILSIDPVSKPSPPLAPITTPAGKFFSRGFL